MPPTSDADLERARFRGALLGLAAGDTLGTTVEFKSPGTFEQVVYMLGGGPFGLAPGQWTDDTSMALCLAESLVVRGGFDPRDQMARYVRWWRDGYLSSTGGFFDIGATVSAALRRFEETGDPYSGSTDPRSAGNGWLMRLAPAVMFHAADPRTAVELAGESSRTTHGAATAVDSCRYLAGLIVGALAGAAKDELLAPRYSPVPACGRSGRSSPRSTRSRPARSSAGSRPRSRGPATSSARSRPRSGPSPGAGASGRGRRSPRTSATTPTRPRPSSGSSRAPTTVRRGSPRGGGRSSRPSRRSRSSPTGCTAPPWASSGSSSIEDERDRPDPSWGPVPLVSMR
jgi:ADP-ribosyl-[dinitrogen reductase] hydrolase